MRNQAIANKYNSVYKSIALWMIERNQSEEVIDDIINHITKYVNNNKITTGDIKVAKQCISIKNDTFSNVLEFIDYVHGNFPIIFEPEFIIPNQTTDIEPVLTGDGIKIFKVESPSDSIALAGDTTWCIAYRNAKNMWQDYRNTNASTFFIIWDENPPHPNQRKVALDYTSYKILITDIPNKTGVKLSNNISFQYDGETITGNDVPTYLKYLQSKNVDINAKYENTLILQNKPLTEAESLTKVFYEYYRRDYVLKADLNIEIIKEWFLGEATLLPPKNCYMSYYDKHANTAKQDCICISIEHKKENGSKFIYLPKNIEHKFINPNKFSKQDKIIYFDYLKITSELTKTLLYNLIGMGTILENDVFDYIWEIPGNKNLLTKYVNTGLELPREQLLKISTNKQLINSYVKTHLVVLEYGYDNLFFLEFADPKDDTIAQKVLEANRKKQFITIPRNWIDEYPELCPLKRYNVDLESQEEII